MKLKVIAAGLGLLFGALNLSAQFVWVGGGADNEVTTAGNYEGGVAPVGNGGENLEFGDLGVVRVHFPSVFSLQDVSLTGYNTYVFLDGNSTSTLLTLTGDVHTSDSGGYIVFQNRIALSDDVTHAFDLQGGAIYIFGTLEDNGDLLKTGSGELVISSPDNSSTYTGNVDLQGGEMRVAGDGALGSGYIRMGGGRLSVATGYDQDNTVILDNSVVLSDLATFGRPNDDPTQLTISGPVTLEPFSTIEINVIQNMKLTLLGDITETTPGTQLLFSNDGTVVLGGSFNGYTGGTTVDRGVVIFASDAPTTGALVTTDIGDGIMGYLGTAVNTNVQNNFIDRFNRSATTGIIGFDTLGGGPAQTFGESIDLTGFDPAARIGTATSAILAGYIKPQADTYQFAGRGVLTVDDALSDFSGTPYYVVASGGLQLFLTNTNLYTGGTTARDGAAVVFNGLYAVPNGPLVANLDAYIGATEQISDSVSGFIARFDQANTYGVVGFDSTTTRTVTDPIDLTGFQSSVFLGTSTSATFNNVITPQSNAYRFTGFRNGQLTVNSTLSDIDGSNSRHVVIGLGSNDVFQYPDPDFSFFPSVTLAGNNTYTGGTTLQSGELIVGSNAALGTGALTIAAFNPISAGLSTNTDGLVIGNAIDFGPFNGNNYNDLFTLHGAHDFTLSGDMIGGDSVYHMFKTGLNVVTISGDNSGLLVGFRVRDGEMIFTTDTAAGNGNMDLINGAGNDPGGVIHFTSAAPEMGSLSGDNRTGVELATSGRLTINQLDTRTYDGVIYGTGGLIKDGPGDLTLRGANVYDGGTDVATGALRLDGGSITHASADLRIATTTYSSGTFTVQNGGVITAQNAEVSTLAFTNAGLIVDGADSTATFMGYLRVGFNQGNGYLDISNGAAVSSESGEIGDNNSSSGDASASLYGDGSSWTIQTTLTLANSAAVASMHISDHSLLSVAGGTGTIEMALSSDSAATLILGDSEGNRPGGILNVAAINGGAGSAELVFDTDSSFDDPYYLTKDGMAAGTPVQLTGGLKLQNSHGVNVLSGTNTYSGGTWVLGGTLVVASNGALGSGAINLNGGDLSVANGVTLTNTLNFTGVAVLSGNGTFGTPITVGTDITLSPGNSPGNLTFSSGLTWAPGGRYDWQLQTNAGGAGTSTGWDLITVTGSPLDLSALTTPGDFTLHLISLDGSSNPGSVSDFNPAAPFSWTILTSAAGITNAAGINQITIDAADFVNYPDASHFALSISSGTDLVLTFTPVPEPSTYALLGLGLLGVVSLRRKQR